MTTFVGTQTEFINALKELVELDYDAIEAYEAAINRLESLTYKSQLESFKEDHERHVRELNRLLEEHGEDPIEGPSSKQWLTKGKVLLANLIGDKAIISAMITNEEDTNKAYERLNAYTDKWPDAVEILQRGLADERRHKNWLENNQNLED